MAGINQIPKLSYWASSTYVNKMIMTLNQVLIDLQAKPAKALIANTEGELPSDNIEIGTLGIAKDTSFMYYFSGGT